MLKTRKWKFQNFWGPEWIRTGGPPDLENLLSKFKSQMLENGALWASFLKMVHCIADIRSRSFGIAHCVRTKLLHKLIYVPNQSQSVPFRETLKNQSFIEQLCDFFLIFLQIQAWKNVNLGQYKL